MEMENKPRRDEKGRFTKADGGDVKIARDGSGDLGTMEITNDDLKAVRKALERSVRLPHGRLQQRME